MVSNLNDTTIVIVGMVNIDQEIMNRTHLPSAEYTTYDDMCNEIFSEYSPGYKFCFNIESSLGRMPLDGLYKLHHLHHMVLESKIIFIDKEDIYESGQFRLTFKVVRDNDS